jgi:hypothetical protein
LNIVAVSPLVFASNTLFYLVFVRINMYYHLVLLKIKPDASEEQMENFFVGLKSLSIISGVVSLQIEKINNNVYRGYDNRTKGYTHALMVVLKNKSALEGYDKDHFHLLVKSTIIKPLLDTTLNDPVLAVDWEGEAAPCSIMSLLTLQNITVATGLFAVICGMVVLRSRL